MPTNERAVVVELRRFISEAVIEMRSQFDSERLRFPVEIALVGRVASVR